MGLLPEAASDAFYALRNEKRQLEFDLTKELDAKILSHSGEQHMIWPIYSCRKLIGDCGTAANAVILPPLLVVPARLPGRSIMEKHLVPGREDDEEDRHAYLEG
jgi:hypothetical protein